MAGKKDEKAHARVPAIPQKPVAPGAKLGKSRLSVMPLAVLLPTLGEARDLHRVAPNLERRLGAIQDQAQQRAADDPEGEAGRAVEESMLNQVLQWLSVERESE